MKKKLAIALVCILLVVGIVGGTLAWLTDTTESVTNTFTIGDIDITLKESENLDLKMIPGWTIDKDPVVTVLKDSEDCWLFIKVEESENLDDYITYEIDPNNWTKLEGVEGVDNVYYCYAKDITADRAIKVLGYTDEAGEFHPNQVLVNDTVTEAMMEDLKGENATQPTLTFTAYATQYYKNNTENFTPAEAWEVLNPPAETPAP